MKHKNLMGALAAIAVAAASLTALAAVLAPIAQRNAEQERHEMMALLLPGSTAFTPEPYSGEDESISAVYKGEGGFVVETVTGGYVGDITLLVGVSNDGEVTGVVVRDLEETCGLGANALRDTEFLSQFLHTTGEAAVGETVDAMTGATVSSKAIARGVNAAVGFVTGADVTSSATEWEG